MNLNTPVVRLCIEGSRAEFDGRREERMPTRSTCKPGKFAAMITMRASLHITWRDFNKAQRKSYELIGDLDEAKHYYGLAAELGYVHQLDSKLDSTSEVESNFESSHVN